ncbi:hypothetical protein F5Y16DRAFT_398391 [Xylariaceae sp. FL0255]|nr:hypothetical protein F5Y16DRAFT_398391 [Xylariaceae sp. FL0255]
MERPAKRVCHEVNHDSSGLPTPTIDAQPQPDYEDQLAKFNKQELREILSSLYRSSPAVQAAIQSRYDSKMRMMKKHVVNLDGYSKEAWRILNSSVYANMRSSQQWEAAHEAISKLEKCIDAISKKTPNASSFGTKLSALETLGDSLGKEVHIEFQSNDCLGATMLRIAMSMTQEECQRAGENRDEKASLIEKLEWLSQQAESYCLEGFAPIDEVLELLRDVGEPYEDEGEDQDGVDEAGGEYEGGEEYYDDESIDK